MCSSQLGLAVVEEDARPTQHATVPLYREVERCNGNGVAIFRCRFAHRNRDCWWCGGFDDIVEPFACRRQRTWLLAEGS